MNVEDVLDSVPEKMHDRHTTLYCSPQQEKQLIRHIGSSVSGMTSSDIESVTIRGITVEPLPGIEKPILCKKGDIFPLAKEYE